MDNEIRISSAAVSDRGLSDKRPQNEDSFLEMGQRGIFAVADGVGGAQAGEVASQMAVEILGEAFTNFQVGADAETVMRTAIERANGAINRMAMELPQLSNMATTVVALHLAGNIATIGHVGDSRLYRVDRDGNIYRETADHSMVAEEVRAGRMTEEQAENHPSRNIISRALGAEPTVEAEIKTIMVDPGTSFLLCSDGITRHVNDQEIKGVLTFGGDPVDICDYLKGLCYERGAEDNLTAVIVKVTRSSTDTVSEPIQSFTSIEEDEPTVATARPPWEEEDGRDDDDQLLELDTRELIPPMPADLPVIDADGSDLATVPFLSAETNSDSTSDHILSSESSEPRDTAQDRPASEISPEVTNEPPEIVTERAKEQSFTIFGETDDVADEAEKSGTIGRFVTAVGLLIVGIAGGLGIYHFALVPKAAEPTQPPFSEMKAANIPLSAFEENRRGVDKDPAAYIVKFGAAPQDVDDYYLLGRAYMLTGDYVKARAALTEARTRLSEAEPVNAKVLASDIAVAMVIMNSTTAQTMLAKELEPTKSSVPVNSNINSGSMTNSNVNR